MAKKKAKARDTASSKVSEKSPVERYRARMRRSGLRLVQLWVPDTRAPGFRDECRRQVARAARHQDLERDIIEWADGVSDTTGWTW